MHRVHLCCSLKSITLCPLSLVSLYRQRDLIVTRNHLLDRYRTRVYASCPSMLLIKEHNPVPPISGVAIPTERPYSDAESSARQISNASLCIVSFYFAH